MKQLLFTCIALLISHQQVFAQPDRISEGIFAYNSKSKKMVAGNFYFFNDKVGPSLSISGLIFSEVETGGHLSVIGGVGPTLMRRNYSIGVMFGFVNNETMLSITPWAYVQSTDHKWSGLAMFIIEKDKINYMIEALRCFELPKKDFELGVGILNLGTFGGPYVRVSKGNSYFGVNPAFNFLPEIKNEQYGETTQQYENYHSATAPVVGEKSGVFLHFVIGTELPCNRCKSIDHIN